MTIDRSSAASSLPFREWKAATEALRRAESRGAPHVELVRLSEAVIRTRNVLTQDWLAAGLALPEQDAIRAAVDEELLRQPDDTTFPDL
jgi:hypothetical protein